MEERTAFDVVVIGAGPAGSTLAFRLARCGFNVLLLEGKRFPRPHIGESLLAMSMPFFDDLKVADAIHQAGFIRKTGSIFVWGEMERHLPMGAPGYAFQVPRDQLDELLLHHAASHGVTVWQECWARDVVLDEEGRVLGVTTGGARVQQVNARFVADASGLCRFLARRFKLPVASEGPPRAAIVMYAQGASRYDEPFQGDIVTEAAANGWMWFIPLSSEITSVGWVGDYADMSGSPAAILSREIESTRVIRRLLSTAKASNRPQQLRYSNQIVAAPLLRNCYALLGDAAMFVDPLFSTGVHAALYSAACAAACIATMLRASLDEQSASAFYEQRMRAHYRRVAATVRTLYGANRGPQPFWERRDLGTVTYQEAEQMSRDLGAAGMRFFQGAVNSADLPIPQFLAERADEFITEPRPQPISEHVVLQLGKDVHLSDNWTVEKDYLVPAVHAAHAANRTVAVEYGRGSSEGRMLRAIEKDALCFPAICERARIERSEWARARWFAGTMVASGILRIVE